MKDDIHIFDFDGTLIDSSHRQITNADGSINLKHWRANNTRDMIFSDTLLPLYAHAYQLANNGAYLIGCTARELTKADWEFFFLYGFDKLFKKIISRPKGNETPDHILKSKQLRYLFNLKSFKNRTKHFYDDNEMNRYALMKMGAYTYEPNEFIHRQY